MNIFKPNTDRLDTFYEKGRFTLAWRLCVIFSFTFFVLSIVFINSSIPEILSYVLCLVVSTISLVYLYRTNKYRFIYYFLAISGTVIAIYTSNSINSVLHLGDFLWMILIITFSFFGIGKKFGMLILGIHLLNVCYYTLYTVNDNISEIIELDLSGRIALMIELLAATISITYVVFQFLVFHNYSFENVSKSNEELSEQNTVIQQQHNEKSVLIKEVHHRVKNNLQIIVSLLRLQQNDLKSDESKSHFNEAINRIMVMSLIHQKLYQDETLADIKLETYLVDLKNEILKLSTLSIPLEVEVNTAVDRVGLKTIVPLGLIVNELMSNSIEHAFQNSTKALILIEIKSHKNDSFELVYSDNGQWKTREEEKTGFGLELIETLTSQLDGSVKREVTKDKTVFTFLLKNLDIEK